MGANDMQVGGNHYSKEYQHWDFAIDTHMPYVIGCTTKYISRWQQKNGIEDLNKAIHYLDKAEESYQYMDYMDSDGLVDKYCSQLRPEEAAIIRAIFNNEFAEATLAIKEIIVEHTVAETFDIYTRG